MLKCSTAHALRRLPRAGYRWRWAAALLLVCDMLMDVQGHAEVNGTRLYYEVAGQGSPVVLIHGFPLDSSMWDEQFEAFARRYRVLRYDVRGFGRSALPGSEPYSHAEDLRALLDHLHLGPAVVSGLSMGGQIAIDFALAYPERTRGLISVDSGPTGYAFSEEWDRLMQPIWRASEEVSVEEKKRRWLAHPMFVPVMERPMLAARMRSMVDNYSGWHWMNKNPVRWGSPAAVERLHEIQVPTLVVLGERDLPDLHAIADLLEKRISHASKLVLSATGHMANMETPREFTSAVLDFLARV